MKKGTRFDFTRTKEIFKSSKNSRAPNTSSAELPASFVPVVLDGKRVNANEIASRNAQPLHYTIAPLKSGETALIGFSDRSVIDNLFLDFFQGQSAAPDNPVDNALRSAGLERRTTMVARSEDGFWMYEDIDFGGDVKYEPQLWVNDDLHEYTDGRELFEGSWGDQISSVRTRNAPTRVWADVGWEGDSLLFGAYSDVPNLHVMGWGDRISSVMVGPRPGMV